MADFNSQLDDLIEYKKLIVKLEEALKQKDLENTKLSKMNFDLTKLCDEIKSELNEQSNKILSQNSEIKNLTKKYEQQIISLNNEHEKQKQQYDEKILELSSYNPQNQRLQIKNEIESKYNNILKNKDLEISNLKNEINELKQNITLKETELNLLKKNLNDQLYTERETHSFQIKDLLSKINNQNEIEKNNEDKIVFEELKSTIQYNDEKNELLYKELDNIRQEKNINEIKYNKKIFELDTQLKEAIFNIKILNDEKESFHEDINNIKKLILQKDKEIYEVKMENKILFEENNDLKRNIEEMNENDDELKKGLRMLKNFVRISNERKMKDVQNSSKFIESKINQSLK